METFDFPFHTVEDEYPASSTTMKFGGGYQFASKPTGPDQITFKLNFKAMWFYEGPPGTVDATSNPKINMQKLIEFYEAHRLYEPFEYPHPRRGTLTVRFAKPLKVPDYVEKGRGQLQPFSVDLILLP